MTTHVLSKVVVKGCKVVKGWVVAVSSCSCPLCLGMFYISLSISLMLEMEFTFFATFSENVKHDFMNFRKQHPVGKEFFLIRFLICFLLQWWEDSAQHKWSTSLKNHHHLHSHSSEWPGHLRNITRNSCFVYFPFFLLVLQEIGG